MAKFDDTEETEIATLEQPDPLVAVANILKLWKLKNKQWPDRFPPSPRDAAAVWLGMQEPVEPREQARRIPIPQERGKPVQHRWETPYIARITASLRAFLQHNGSQQRYIVAAIEDGIVYRGDDNIHKYKQLDGLTLFQSIVKETEHMREIGVVAYRKQHVGRVPA